MSYSQPRTIMNDIHVTPIKDPAQPMTVLKAWTDYPIIKLGDRPNEVAPVRECTPVRYDNDKYVTVLVGGIETSFKSGYLYDKPGRYGEVPVLNPRLINQYRWVRDCSCGAKIGEACRSLSCKQLKDRYDNR